MVEFKTAPGGYRVFVNGIEEGFYNFFNDMFIVFEGKLEFRGIMLKEQVIEYFEEMWKEEHPND